MTANPTTPLTILHTSDWHLGRRLYGHQRYAEFEAFLAWLLDSITTQRVDILIVAGDIFDTMAPSNKAQALYYEFLTQVSATCCQHIVIVAGNHDSPSFLDAPSQLLKWLNVHVIGTACENVGDEVLVLENNAGTPYAIVAAVPYLRDRDVRISGAGESMDSKDANVISGICAHYDAVAAQAQQQQRAIINSHSRRVPIIATGHLFAAGGSTTDDDGVRDLYVGNLGKISADMFSPAFDYVALGHLHVPQKVGGCEHIRYSGSPIAMGFGEARQQKQVLLVQFSQTNMSNKVVDGKDGSFEKTANLSENKRFSTPTPTAHNNDLYSDDLFGFDSDEDSDLNSNHLEQTADEQTANIEPISDSISTAMSMTITITITPLPIPSFQDLAQVSGDMTAIKSTIQTLTQSRSAPIWLEVVYEGREVVGNLREQIEVMVEGLPCAVLKIKNMANYDKVLQQHSTTETLQDLTTLEVFERCLAAHQIAESQKLSLTRAYQQILSDIDQQDRHAE